jgi:hypothetical protein
MSAAGYQSWFVSARDEASARALWIRHSSLRPRQGPGSSALWCTVVDRALSERPIVVKQAFAVHPPEAAAGAARFRGSASMGGRAVRWELGVTARDGPLRPLRPGWLYRAPFPRTKVEATVPDGMISGTLEIDGQVVAVTDWRGTVGHNWGTEHADSWVWLHAAGFGAASDGWLELVLARIRVGPARSPWVAAGALSVGDGRFWVGGFGHRPRVDARPDGLAARIPSPAGWLELSVTTAEDGAVAVAYADPSGGDRRVRHAALATMDLTWHSRGRRDAAWTTCRGAYEFGASQGMDEIELEALPDG